MEITGDIKQLLELTKGISLAEQTLKEATVSAINKSIVSVRVFAAKEISREYKVTQTAVKKELGIFKANVRIMSASLKGEGKPGIPLYSFSPTPRRVPSTIQKKGVWEDKYTKFGKKMKRQQMIPGSNKYSPKLGIKVMVHRGSRKMVRTAFIAKMSSGHVGIFSRRKGSKSIDELFGPSPLRILDSPFYQDKINNYAAETMDKNMAHEAEFYLKRAGILPDV